MFVQSSAFLPILKLLFQLTPPQSMVIYNPFLQSPHFWGPFHQLEKCASRPGRGSGSDSPKRGTSFLETSAHYSWIAVKELNLIYYKKETLLRTIYP